MFTSRTTAGSETALLSYSWRQSIFINFFRRFAYHSQHPQGSWHLRCMVFLWQYRTVVHWNRGLPSVSQPTQITLLSLLFELSSCAWFTRALLLVWDVARHGISTPFLKNMFLSFQILVLSYELFISLLFFSHYPGDRESHQIYLQLSNEPIILRLQTVLDLFTTCVRPPWTLLGLPYLRKRGMGILNTRQGEVCMVAPPLLDVHSYFFSLDSHRNLDNVTLRFLIDFVSSIIKDGPAYSICSN